MSLTRRIERLDLALGTPERKLIICTIADLIRLNAVGADGMQIEYHPKIAALVAKSEE